jgi:hypothetical protein
LVKIFNKSTVEKKHRPNENATRSLPLRQTNWLLLD